MRLKHAFIYVVMLLASSLLQRVISNLILFAVLTVALASFAAFSVTLLDEMDEQDWKKASFE